MTWLFWIGASCGLVSIIVMTMFSLYVGNPIYNPVYVLSLALLVISLGVAFWFRVHKRNQIALISLIPSVAMCLYFIGTFFWAASQA